MRTLVHEFDWPDRFVVGTVGSPGARTFYLQARTGARSTSVALEKEQSALLAEAVDELLDKLAADQGNSVSVPTETAAELVDTDPLDQPVEEQFRATALRLGWDPRTAQVIIEAFPDGLPRDDDADDADPDADDGGPSEMLVVRVPVGTARAFAHRTRQVVLAGRPICPLCGQPIDPDGHVCRLLDDV